MCVNHCLVIRSGFEPETHSLEGCCSIQLSYQTPRVSAFVLVLAHEITRAGTLNSAYKGNLDAKVLLFFELCKYFCKILTKVLQKAFATQVCALHLRCDLPIRHS